MPNYTASITTIKGQRYRRLKFEVKRIVRTEVVECISPDDGGTFWNFYPSGEACGTRWDYKCTQAWKSHCMRAVLAAVDAQARDDFGLR